MTIRSILFAVSVLIIALAELPSALASPAIPGTQAGHVLAAWLAAMNSGQNGPLKQFIESFHSPRGIDQEALAQKIGGGYELLNIEESKPSHIVFRVKERNSTSEALGIVDLVKSNPPIIRAFRIYEAPLGVAYKPFVLDDAERKRVVEASIHFLDAYYVFPQVAKQMNTALRANLRHGDFNMLTDGADFGEELTRLLQAISHDKHLSVDFYLFAQPQRKTSDASKGDDNYRARMAADNCGFDRVEHLPGNIGYLKFDAFERPDICGATVVAAMNFLANSDALIVDLRDNGGGYPGMVALIESYLLDEHTHLNDIYKRDEDRTVQSWTVPYVPGKRLGRQPVYVLISRNTFSAAEEFAYTLKALKRATLVGERTAGGAHPLEPHRIDAHFVIEVPFARSINPVTHTDWEGTGVEPDVAVLAGDARKKAIDLAKQKLESARGNAHQ